MPYPLLHPRPNPKPDPDPIPNPDPDSDPDPEQVRAMAEGLKAMPKFQEETARYSLHIHVVGELLKRFNETCLEEVSGLEQDLACGEDAQQKPFKTALADLRALLGRTDLPLSPEDRIRLLMMFVISQVEIALHSRA